MKRMETLRRLGAHYDECPACQKMFNAGKMPRFWLNMYVNGELADSVTFIGDEGQFEGGMLMCSRECADAHKGRLEARLSDSSAAVSHLRERHYAALPKGHRGRRADDGMTVEWVVHEEVGWEP